jgi:hypothetical protein
MKPHLKCPKDLQILSFLLHKGILRAGLVKRIFSLLSLVEDFKDTDKTGFMFFMKITVVWNVTPCGVVYAYQPSSIGHCHENLESYICSLLCPYLANWSVVPYFVFMLCFWPFDYYVLWFLILWRCRYLDYSVDWLMKRELGRKRSWRNRSTVLEFDWGDWGQLWKTCQDRLCPDRDSNQPPPEYPFNIIAEVVCVMTIFVKHFCNLSIVKLIV